MKLQKTSNHQKHTSINPAKRLLIKNFKNTVNSMLDLAESEKVCELGCGEGFMINYLLDKNPSIEIKGFDIDKSVVKIARQFNPSVKFEQADVRKISRKLKKENFDYVLLMEVLEHIHEYKDVLSELSQMNFSRLLISVPNEPLFSYSNLVFGKNVRRLGKDLEHVNFWNKRSFTMLLSNYFDIIECKKPFPWLVCLCKKK